MDLIHIAVFAGAALLYGWLLPARWRGWALMAASVVAIYWLQPVLPIRYLDFIFPTATLALTVVFWLVTREADQPVTRQDKIALGTTAALVVALSATRHLNLDYLSEATGWLTPTASRPPDPVHVAVLLAVLGGVLVAPAWLRGQSRAARLGLLAFILAAFAVFKTEVLGTAFAEWLRAQFGHPVDQASMGDLGWLGFSYVAFRLIHTLRDRQSGKLPALSLRQYLTFVIFFPAYTAGPIDRAERFLEDAQALDAMRGMDPARFVEGGTRIMVGIAKKFVVADSLALFALNPTNAAQAESTLWTWFLLYGYAFRLYFDFSGYTDIAIGVGVLFGIKLPENFNWPYLKTNITAFWQSWHITLSNWVRFYVFSPLSRNLMMRKPRPPLLLIVFTAQMATMIVIGLWHGVTVNFILWGAWHGVGLFVHKMWSDRTRKGYRGLQEKPRLKAAWSAVGVLLTFHFVALSWVWFALPSPALALDVFGKLFGLR